MHYHVNVIYDVEVTSEERLHEIVSALTRKQTFAEATVAVTGYNVNKTYLPALMVEPSRVFDKDKD